ncbi:MAG: phosphoribosyltransferase family protein [Campylobacterales bacterium]
MRCLMCESLSLTHICKTCQKNFLQPQLFRRKIYKHIEVISFYKYAEIKELMHTKHTDLGYYIYNILAKNSMAKFAKEFKSDNKVISLAIDDNIKSGYSHTAILNNSLKSKHIKPLHSKLRAKNDISYSGKSREFRMQNPREFSLKSFDGKDVILVDDLITTGSTLTQAIQSLEKNSKNVLFCLTLADAKV